MKVILVNYEYPPLGGGGGVIMAQLAESLARRGHVIRVLTSGRKGSPRLSVENGVEIHRVRVPFRKREDVASQVSMYSFFPGGVWAGWRRIAPESVDLIHTHFAIPSGPTGILLSRMWRKPHILTTHGGDIYDPSKKLSPHRFPPLRALVRWVLRASDAVTTDFQDLAWRTRDIYGYRPEVEVIPYGLPSVEVPERNRRAWGWDSGKQILVSVARLIPRKGFNFLLEALANIRDIDWNWAVIGSGPEQEPLARQAAQLGISERIQWLGHLPEDAKWRALASADVFVLPSLHEGFGVVNLEAMACGLPIVTTPVGGQSDFLQPERNAILVPPADVPSLTLALRRMLTDGDLRNRLSRQNLEDVTHYRFDTWVDRYENLYRKILEAGRK